jgi:hypothetical protein
VRVALFRAKAVLQIGKKGREKQRHIYFVAVLPGFLCTKRLAMYFLR